MARHGNSDYFASLNEWVAEYLAEKGYYSVLKVFRTELKNDKTSNVDALVDFIKETITLLKLSELTDVWHELDRRLFSRLHEEHAKAAIALEEKLLKLFVVTAVTKGNAKEAQRCLEHMAAVPRLARSPELREWFRIPYIRHPENEAMCAKYLSKFWQETLFVSLYNFLSSAYLTSANELLAQRLKRSQSQPEQEIGSSAVSFRKLQDGFTKMSDSAIPVHQLQAAPNPDPIKSKFLKALQNINPIPRRHASGPTATELPSDNELSDKPDSLMRQKSSPSPNRRAKDAGDGSVSQSNQPPDAPETNGMKDSAGTNGESGGASVQAVLTADAIYGIHETAVLNCAFSPCGTKLLSFDLSGCIKIWHGTPDSEQEMASHHSRTGVSCACWASKTGDLVVFGDLFGKLTLLDSSTGEILMQLDVGSRISALAVGYDSGTSTVACGTDGSEESHYGIFVVDLATFSIRNELRNPSRLTCCSFSTMHSSRLLCGFNTGCISEFGIRFQKFEDSMVVHNSAVQQVGYLSESTIVSVASDGRLLISSLAHKGQKLHEIKLDLPADSVPYPLKHTFAVLPNRELLLVRSTAGVVLYQMAAKCKQIAAFEFTDLKQVIARCIDWTSSQAPTRVAVGFSDGHVRSVQISSI